MLLWVEGEGATIPQKQEKILDFPGLTLVRREPIAEVCFLHIAEGSMAIPSFFSRCEVNPTDGRRSACGNTLGSKPDCLKVCKQRRTVPTRQLTSSRNHIE